MVQLSARMKKFFFDRPLVKSMVDKDTLRFLRNAGGYGRKVARSSMKKKGKARKAPKNASGKAFAKWQDEIRNQPASPAGTPPFAHSDDENRTLRKILFAFHEARRGVIVGPVGLQTKWDFASGATTVPELMERGGTKEILEKQVGSGAGKRWVPLHGRARLGQPVRKRKAKYPPRPFMGPAQQATQAKFPKLWFSSSGVG